MPDLATHALLPILGMRLSEIVTRKRLLGEATGYLFVFGNIFPDLLDKSIPYALYLIFPRTIVFLPKMEFLHSPIMLMAAAYLFCLCFIETFRKRAFIALGAGILSHLMLDLFQGNICDIGYLWFFPFSMQKPMLLNLYDDDASVPLVPILFFTLCGVEIVHQRMMKGNYVPRYLKRKF